MKRICHVLAFIVTAFCVVFIFAGYTYAECPDSISSYWMLDETGGVTYADYLATNDASCAGSCPTPVVNGKIYGGQLFDGISSGIEVPADASFNWAQNDSFSIEYWIKKESGTLNGEEVIIGRYDSTSNYLLKAGIDAGGHALFVLIATNGDGSSSEHYLNGTTILTDNAWHHIVILRDAIANKNILYVDGTVEDSEYVSYTAGFDSSTADLTIGWLELDSGYYYEGILDEIAVYNRALSDMEILQHYNNGVKGLQLGYCGCAGQIKIMPLGDSITVGAEPSIPDDAYRVGYRQKLYFDLLNRGYNVDFIGSQQHGMLAIPSFDNENEGHGGWRDDEIADNILIWLALNPADIILLHIGTNGVNSSPDDVEDVLNNIDLYSEDIIVVLARIINRRYYDPVTTLFNDNVVAMATTRIANGDRIIIVDQESAITYPDDLSDAVHPNSIGYGKMADVWLDSLDDFLPVCNLAAPAIISAPVIDGAENSQYSYDVNATGSMPMTYTLLDSPDPVPAGMIIDQRTGLIEWTPSSTGDYNITVQAANSEGTDNQSFSIHVTPPVLDFLVVQGPVRVDENTSVDYSCVAYYSDGSSQVVEADIWSVDCPLIAGISATGLLTTNEISVDAACSISATYTDGVTKNATFPINIIGNTLSITNSTPIASTHPEEGTTGIILQRFRIDSGPLDNGQVELTSLDLVDNGTVTNILDAQVYISLASLTTLPPNAVMIGNTGVWDGSAVVVTLDGGTASDRTVINGTFKYIYIVYELAGGQAGSTIKSNVTAIGVASSDPVTGSAGTSNLLTVQTCGQSGSLVITLDQTLYGNTVDLTSLVTVFEVTNLFYAVTEWGSICNVDPNGTYIDAENYSDTQNDAGNFSEQSTQGGHLNSGYLKTLLPVEQNIFTTQTPPGSPRLPPDGPIENGVKWRSDVDGYVTGVRFYKDISNTGTHKGRLWQGTTLLANATFANETSSGWQTVQFDSPVAVTAGTTYIVSYHSVTGYYYQSNNYFGAVDNAPLHISATAGQNGVYRYATALSFECSPEPCTPDKQPTINYNANFWVDVLFAQSLPSCSDIAGREYKKYEMHFPAGTYTLWLRGYAVDGADTVLVGVDDNCIGTYQFTTKNQWSWTSTTIAGTNSTGILTEDTHHIDIWTRKANVLIDGIYLTQGDETPTDVTHGITLDPTICGTPVFTGNESQAQSVNTTTWSEGEKNLYISGDDLTCGTPLFPSSGTFNYNPCNDNDNDGYGSPGHALCPNGNANDCNDNDAAVNPGATEIPYNGKDDDCNAGTLDDDLDSDTYPIATDCDDNDAAVNPGAAEVCNNIDDNCDGTVDENLTQSTSCGVGACSTTGEETCTAGVWGGDTCTPGTPTAETCNNIDDNCDGTVDDNLTQSTSCGLGACSTTGEETCTVGVWGGDTCTPGTPAADDATCDGIDDDCDGTDDEDFSSTPTSCGVGACAASGDTTCVAGVPGDTCTPGVAAAETCNNIDDNCDGTVDENLTQSTSCGVGACTGNAGIKTCTAGSWGNDTCDPLAGATAETCNNVDDDCDNNIDDGCDDDGDGYCDDTMTVTGDPVQVCTASVEGPGDDCDDEDDNIYPGGPTVRVVGGGVYYTSLQNAYSLVAEGDTIEGQATALTGDLNANRNISVTLQGGYDCGYSNVIGNTTLNGTITINDGMVTIRDFITQ